MGKLLTGHYGEEPEAESISITLGECHQKLSLKPSDFVSEGPPRFFEKSFGTKGRYLLFFMDAKEVAGNPVWRAGYYLLPIEATEVLRALKGVKRAPTGPILPVRVEAEKAPPPEVQKRVDDWVAQAQPLFFRCTCQYLELDVKPPWGLRRRWKLRLRCPDRCQPAQTTVI